MQQRISSLDRTEVLRYLGYNKQQTPIPPSLEEMISDCMKDTCNIITPRFHYQRATLSTHPFALDGTIPLLGESIQRHLQRCHAVFLLCVTVGQQLDRKIREQMLTAPERGVIYNSCGTAAVEQLADLAQEEIASLVWADGEAITTRFSPGYGDLPLSFQRELLPRLEAHKKLGVSLTENDMMLPEKSVSALIGVYPRGGAPTESEQHPRCKQHFCDTCSHRADCPFANG